VRRLRDEGRGLVYISHALGDVLRLADDVLVLRDGEVVGSARLRLRRGRLITLMVGRSVDTVFPARADAPPGEPALELSRLGRAGAFRDVSLTVRRGEVVGLAGLMGAGRTELLRAVFGLERTDSGEVRVHGRSLRPAPREAIARGVALVTEDRREDGLVLDATIADNLALASLPALSRGGWIDRRALARALAPRRRRCASTRPPPSGGPRARSPAATSRRSCSASGCSAARRWCSSTSPRADRRRAKQHVYRLVADLAAAGTAVLLASSEIEELLGSPTGSSSCAALGGGRASRPEFDRERILAAALGAAPRGPAVIGWLRRWPALGLLVFVAAVFSALSPEFLAGGTSSTSRAVGLARDRGHGMAFVLLTAGIDLSVGSAMFVSAALAGKMVVAGWGSAPPSRS